MNCSAHVLGSGNKKINISQSVVLLEFNRKTTVGLLTDKQNSNPPQEKGCEVGIQLPSSRILAEKEQNQIFVLSWSVCQGYSSTISGPWMQHLSVQAGTSFPNTP